MVGIVGIIVVNLALFAFNILCNKKLMSKKDELMLKMIDAELMVHDAYYTELSEICVVLIKNNRVKQNALKDFFVYKDSSLLEKVDLEEYKTLSKYFEEHKDVLKKSMDYDEVYMFKQKGIYFFIKDSVVEDMEIYDYEYHKQYIENMLDNIIKGESILKEYSE